LPPIPTGLVDLECYGNPLTSLPPLPEGLTNLSFSNICLSQLPEIPLTLKMLSYRDYNLKGSCFMKYLKNEPHSEYITRYREMKRVIARCAAFKERLMEFCWHPDRLASIIERCGSSKQWNHHLCEYGTLDFNEVDEIM
jgi:hypothetical protein